MSIEINSIKNTPSPNIQTAGVAFKTNPLPQDKVEISSKKKGLSDGAKIGIGVGIIAVVGLAFELIWGKGKHLKSFWEKISGKGVNSTNPTENSKKYLDRIDDIKENFSKIFGRDFTKDEANEMALKYKEIFETTDDTDFMAKVFVQIRKDYNLPKIPFDIGKLQTSEAYAEWGLIRTMSNPNGGLTYNKNLVKYIVNDGKGKFVEIDRPHVIKSLAHEMKHAKQDEIACRVDLQKYMTAFVDCEKKHDTGTWQQSLRECNNNIDDASRKLTEKMYETMMPAFKNLEKIPEGSPLYQKGLEYIENKRNYICPLEDLNGYRNQLVEKEAFDAGNRMEQIYKWLTNK